MSGFMRQDATGATVGFASKGAPLDFAALHHLPSRSCINVKNLVEALGET